MLPDFSPNVQHHLYIATSAPGFCPSSNTIPAHFLFEVVPAPECGCVAGRGDEDGYVCVECESVMMACPAEFEPYPEELRRLEDAELVQFKEAA